MSVAPASGGLRAAFLAVQLCAVACAPVPSTVEHLDEETGVTVHQVSRPLEFHSPVPESLAGSWFAYVGAFEVNRMGELNRYIWVSVVPSGVQPEDERKGWMLVQVKAGRRTIEPRFASASPERIGLSRRPYRQPAEWAREGYFEVSLEDLRAMRDAASLTLLIDMGGGERRYEPWNDDRSPLRAFVDQLR